MRLIRHKINYKEWYEEEEKKLGDTIDIIDDALFELKEKNYKKVKHLLKRARYL